MKKGLNLLLGLLFVIVASGSFAQHTVTIVPSVTEACAPANISFTSNVENCSGVITEYYWLAGNGDDSYDEEATFSYISGNTYTISLSVTCDGVQVTETIEIQIYDSPVAAIDNTPIEICVGDDALFTDASTPGQIDGPIVGWLWYFGDGTSSTTQNPSHAYSSSSIFNISLIVTDNHGCTDEATVNGLVDISSPPVVSFEGDEPNWCFSPHDVEFTADVTTSLSLGYTVDWDFGDGASTSSDTNPTHTYTADGLYDVALTVIDDYGCGTTVTYPEYVQITSPTPEYSVLEGDIVCKDQEVHFQNETSYDCSWDFGDGSPVSFSPTPLHFFHNSGDYTVTFTIDPGGLCEASTQFTLTVEEVTASFTTDPVDLTGCNEVNVVFTTTTSDNVTSWFWNFGDGNVSEEANPNYTYTTPGGPYLPILTVMTDNECMFSFPGPEQVYVVVPDASFVGDETEGCAPFEVNFTHTGTTPQSEILTYSWDFNNGQTIPDGNADESATFDAGEYTVTLTIVDVNGCEGESTFDLQIGEHYSNDFGVVDIDSHLSLSSNVLCAQTDSVSLYFAGYEEVDEFFWLIDSTSNETTTEEYYDWAYDQDTGSIYFDIVTFNDGCWDTIFWDSLYFSGPIINSIDSDGACGSLDYTFTLNHTLADTWDWEIMYFDPPTDYANPHYLDQEFGSSNLSHDYLFANQDHEYWIRVTAHSDTTSCEYVDSISLSISDSQAIFTLIDTVKCANEVIILNGGLSQNATEYYWDFGDGTNSGWITESATQHIWPSPGYYTITLTVKDANECESVIDDVLHILGPDIDIDVDETFGCNSLTVHFDEDIAADEAVSSIIWDFMNGDQLYGPSVEYTYDEPGTYSVKVWAQTISECLDDTVFVDLITVSSVDADFSAPNQIACIDDDITFTAEETDPLNIYTWNYGEGADVIGNEYEVSHPYTAGGYFDVSLHVENPEGCKDSVTYGSYIMIQDPTANFSLDDNVLDCYPEEADIIQNSTVDPPEAQLYYSWDMGDGEVISIEEPDYLYTAPGDYTIELTIETSAGCTDTYSQDLIVEGPYAEVVVSTTDACVGEPVHFEMTNMNTSIDSYLWVVGGGHDTIVESFYHTYHSIPPDGFYPISLTLTSGTFPNECIVPIVENINIHDALADIQITDTDLVLFNDDIDDIRQCAPFDAILTSDSDGDDNIKWYVDGDLFSESDNPTITFENTTTDDLTIDVELAIEDAFGCTDTATTTINVYPLPQVNIATDTIICYGDELGIWVTGGDIYNWSPNEAITDVSSPTPAVSPIENTLYSVMAYTNHNCEASDSVFITVMTEPDIILTPEIDSIMIGDTVYSMLIADQENLTFFWTPQSYISCFDCPMPYFVPEEDMRYNLTVEDSLGCFRHNYYIDIIVREEYSLDVPKAFTPEGSAENQVVYVRGFGIKKLLEFRIFNRWGEEMFYTDDITKGWNGYYKGQLQNIDNYSFYVEAEMYDGSVRNKKGYIMLIR